MTQIESFDGKKKEIGCIGCAIESGEVDYSRAEVIRTRHFNVHQNYEIPISGFFIVSTRKHILSIADFSEEEQKEFVSLIAEIRKGIKETLKIKRVALFQNENSPYHFHLWIFPWLSWMKEFGDYIASMKPIMEYAREKMKTQNNLRAVDGAVKKMRKYMMK